MLVLRALSTYASGLVVVGMSLACGDAGLVCGEGTVERDGACVSADGSGGSGGTSASGGSGGGVGGQGGLGTGGSGGSGGSDLPVAGDPCPTDGAGQQTLGTPCVGDVLFACWGDYVEVTDCASFGGTCAPNPSLPNTNRCTGGPFTECNAATESSTCFDEDTWLYCDAGQWRAHACALLEPGHVCATAPETNTAYCVPPGTTTCDSATYVDGCSVDQGSRLQCIEGLLLAQECGGALECANHPWDGSPVCVPPGAVPCPADFDPACVGASSIELCDANTGFLKIQACPIATSCATSLLDIGACVTPGTPTCDPAVATWTCADADHLVSCGSHGFEITTICASVCVESPGSDACGQPTLCDPLTYAPNCAGSVAQNCHPFGYVTQSDCALVSFPPTCAIQGGSAVCP